jgi:hypothetical protein
MDAKKRKREFILGLILMIAFLVVLGAIFSPIFNGKNGMEYMDNLYNSISKGSAYYIPEMQEEAAALQGKNIDAAIKLGSEIQAERVAALFNKNGVQAVASGREVQVSGDLGVLFQSALEDAEAMYRNNAEAVQSRYGFDAKAALYNWWSAAKAIDKTLSKEHRFEIAKTVSAINSKAIEASYNYFGIEPRNIGEEVGVVIFSLVFYVIYTLWYGFAILFMFEGSGFRLEH